MCGMEEKRERERERERERAMHGEGEMCMGKCSWGSVHEEVCTMRSDQLCRVRTNEACKPEVLLCELCTGEEVRTGEEVCKRKNERERERERERESARRLSEMGQPSFNFLLPITFHIFGSQYKYECQI